MAAIHLIHGAWVLVADGRKAVVYRNQGDPDLPDLRVVESFTHAAAATHDLGTDRPGRVYGADGRRSAVEATDFHEAEETRFLHDVAGFLDGRAAERAFSALVVVAPPKVLGTLRAALPAAVLACLVAELGKDLAHCDAGEVERHLKVA